MLSPRLIALQGLGGASRWVALQGLAAVSQAAVQADPFQAAPAGGPWSQIDASDWLRRHPLSVQTPALPPLPGRSTRRRRREEEVLLMLARLH